MTIRRVAKILLCISLVGFLTACTGASDIVFIVPTEVVPECYIELKGKSLFVGDVFEVTDAYEEIPVKGTPAEKGYKQKQGFYDVGVSKDNIIVNIRTASKEIVLCKNIYCGQSLEEFESHLVDYTKSIMGNNYYVYFNDLDGSCFEVLVDTDDVVSTIRMSSIEI